ncbi:hypothetical protein Z517_00664 [Fonsecaea pedrosoi CBS 271.37]|uniref:Uncharacterized protein n=1 Tax=Fonsecaea pedrosoi CBS 271.37 TaxID=1442368 RepID=A0A0D2HL93_9EURO|nr:uncharacterized protein Z517_00664 [Fonsecaea pedrosoi CBS 271.37]KIW85274.1 hypothetical protein Z517_00664 [Fonsecaea pedrosoi CBS 271.37]
MAPRSRALQSLKPLFNPVPSQSLQTSRTASRHAQRTYASTPTRPNVPGTYNSRVPLIAIGSVLAFVPFYYLFHSTKPAASGNAAITEARRQGDPSTEYRDPRDSPVKTLEQQKKAKAQAGGKGEGQGQGK